MSSRRSPFYSIDDDQYYYQQSRLHHSASSPSPWSAAVVAVVALVCTSFIIICTWVLLLGRPRATSLLYYLEGLIGYNWVLAMVMGWLGTVEWHKLGAGLAIDPDDDDESTFTKVGAGAWASSSSSFAAAAALLPPPSGDPKGTMYPGLLNAAGNLCFLNATLQSIASLPPLLHYLESLPSTSTCPSSVITTLSATLHALNAPSLHRPPPLRPIALAHALAASSETRRRLLSSRDQQDAHELLGMIREAIEEEVGKRRKEALRREKAGWVIVEEDEGTRTKKKKRSGWIDSSIRDPWLLLTSQRIKCLTCGYTRDVRHTGDQQVELQVPFITHCTLYDLLEDWTKMDLLSDYACRKCCLASTLTKLEAQRDRLALVAPPQNLTTSNPTSSSAPSTGSFDPLVNAPTPTMTSSRKDRKRKVQKVVNQVKAAWDAGDYEHDFGPEIKVEKVLGPAGKVVRLARTPEILTFHLSRSAHLASYGGVAIKNSCRVEFPEYLDISPFSDDPPPQPTNLKDPSSSSFSTIGPGWKEMYRLCSLVVHYGTHSFGHYVAYRRRPPLPPHLDSEGNRSSNDPEGRVEWYRVSDETVEDASLEEALRGNPFLLFYEKVKVELGTARVIEQHKGLEDEEGEARSEARVLRRWQVGATSRSTVMKHVEG